MIKTEIIIWEEKIAEKRQTLSQRKISYGSQFLRYLVLILCSMNHLLISTKMSQTHTHTVIITRKKHEIHSIEKLIIVTNFISNL